MEDLTGIYWVLAAAVLFGTQFIPSKYCPKFKSSSYNVSIAWGILACSIVAFIALGAKDIEAELVPYAFVAGIFWVVGNYLLVVGVAKAGMARAFCIVNFSAVVSFIGGGLLLNEWSGLTGDRIAMKFGAVGLVIVGALLVTTTTPAKKDKGSDGGQVMKGIMASFVATVFFSIFNILMGYVINGRGTTPGPAFLGFSPGIMVGALLVAAMPGEKGIQSWLAAPGRWHLLAIAQGTLWSSAMVCIMYGWIGVGIAVGTPMQVGTQTIITALLGIILFKEFQGMTDRARAYGRFITGAALTITGVALIATI